MARSLRGIISTQFLGKLNAASRAGSSAQKAFGQNSSSSAVNSNLSSTLRFGAQVFGTAVTTLNATIDSVNLSRSALQDLGDLTDRLIRVAEKATKPGIGKQTRQKLDAEFQSIGSEFQEIVEKNNLEVDELEDVFTQIGLGPEQSKQIADIFSEFISADGTDTLASQESISSNPQIPGFAYGQEPGTETTYHFTPTNYNTNPSSFGSATGVGTVYEGLDEFGDNKGKTSVNIQTNEPLFGALLPGLTSNIDILHVNEDTGDFLFTSSDELFGSNNSDGVDQLYLGDKFGNVIHQYTDFDAGTAATITDVDMAEDNQTVIISYNDGVNFEADQITATVGDFSSNVSTNIESGSAELAVAVNRDASNYAIVDTDSGNLFMYDASLVSDGIDRSGTIYEGNIDFVHPSTVVAIANGGGEMHIVNYNELVTATVDLSSTGMTAQASSMSVYEMDEDYPSGYIAFYETGNQSINIFSSDGSSIDTLNFEVTALADYGYDSVSQTSLAIGDDQRLQLAVTAAAGADQSEFLLLEADPLGGAIEHTHEEVHSDFFTDADQLTSAFVYSKGYVFEAFAGASSPTLLGYNSHQSAHTYVKEDVSLSLVDSISDGYEVQVLAVNNKTGFSVIESTQNFLGYNASERSNLFLVDHFGRIVSQVTANDRAGFVYTEADISEDNLIVAYKVENGVGVEIGVEEASGYGGDPTLSTNTQIDVFLLADGDGRNIRLSDSGTNVGYYYDAVSDTDELRVYDVATQTVNATLAADGSATEAFTFIDSDVIAYAKEDGELEDIVTFAVDTNESAILVNDVNKVGKLEATEGTGTNFQVFYEDSAIQTLNVVDRTGVVLNRVEYDGLNDSIGGISIGYDGSLGVSGTFSGNGPDQTNFYYTPHSFSITPTTGQPLNRATTNYTGIFSGERTLTRMPDAYSLISDLKELKSQIENNIEVLDETESALNQNLELLRATGLEFLELSNQISSETEAEDVARTLRKNIRSSAGSALGAIGNIEDIVEKALGIDPSLLYG